MQTRNIYNQNIGPEIENWARRPLPPIISLKGKYCLVTPLSVDHAEDLFHAWQSIDDDRDWTYLSAEKPKSKEGCYNYFRELNASHQGLHLSVLDKVDGTVKGIFCVSKINADQGTFDIAEINWTPAMKRTRISTEALYLVISYFIEVLHYRRCEWRTNIFNEAAIKSAERIGFRKEGILRDKKVTKGHSEDIALFSIIATDWHSIDKAIQCWLLESNFDGLGRQVRKLEAFRDK